MNHIAPRAEPLTRDIPLSRLALAPENVRKTPPDPQADAALKASIAAIDLLENLVVRPDDPDEDAVVAERDPVDAGGGDFGRELGMVGGLDDLHRRGRSAASSWPARAAPMAAGRLKQLGQVDRDRRTE